jgi:hypothetical protein
MTSHPAPAPKTFVQTSDLEELVGENQDIQNLASANAEAEAEAESLIDTSALTEAEIYAEAEL